LVTWMLGDAMLRRRDAESRSEPRLLERVRARIGDLVSRPEAIEVDVEGGMVRVSGRVLASELDRLLSQLIQVPGVHRVYNALDRVDDAAGFNQFSGPAPLP
jgi:osmotically-inducible protein OsmY